MQTISTGSLNLDLALGTGGIPRGEITEMYGPPSSGKTTIALHHIAQAQQLGLRCLFIDMENGLNPRYARSCGVDEQEMLLALPPTGDEALEMCYTTLQGDHIDLVVIDSVAALVTQAELGAAPGTPDRGEVNRLLSAYLRKIKRVCKRTGGSLLCTNQLRSRIKAGYGTPETTPGGMAIKFHAGLRIELRVGEHIRRDNAPVGVKISATINKSRFSPIKRSTTIEIVYNIGIVRESELFSLGRKFNLIKRQGPGYRYRAYDLGQDPRAVLRTLKDKVEIAQSLEQDIHRSYQSDSNAVLTP